MCTFEGGTCLDDDFYLQERWIIIESAATKWDNTLNIGCINISLFMEKQDITLVASNIGAIIGPIV